MPSETSALQNLTNVSPSKRAKQEEDKAGMRCLLKFAKLTEKAFKPTKGSARAAGFDLYAAYQAEIPPHGKALIKTDLQVIKINW